VHSVMPLFSLRMASLCSRLILTPFYRFCWMASRGT
jgi:hypothetical protein